MQVQKTCLVLVAALILTITGIAWAQEGQGIPVDVPGTGVNFFLYRFEGEQTPYNEINQIWANLSTAFVQWVKAGQKPEDLSKKDVHVKVNPSGSVSIYIKDQFIVEIDEYHAKINRATPRQLAEVWAENLKAGVEQFVSTNELKKM